MKLKKVTFKDVLNPQEKLAWLQRSVLRAFEAGKAIYIYVEDLKVAQFVDNFLWEYPLNSFIPHSIEDGATHSKVAIGWVSENLNQAEHLVNLSKKALLIDSIITIDEFSDLSNDDNQEILGFKKKTYASARFQLV
jgi:DNA polymerase IIIc chi subunit